MNTDSDVIGYLDNESFNYYVSLSSNSFQDQRIIIATGEYARELLNKGKGENYSLVKCKDKDALNYLSFSLSNLDFIIQTMIDWMKNHINQVSIKDFQFFCRCILRRDTLKEKAQKKLEMK